MAQMTTMTDFQEKHSSEAEPWGYSEKAAEILRHQWVAEQSVRLVEKFDAQMKSPAAPNLVLDVGCSFGQLSSTLLRSGLNLRSIDISSSAVEKTQQKLDTLILGQKQLRPFVSVGSGTQIPFPNSTFAVVLFSDGLEGWELSAQQKLQALREAYRVLKPGGFAVLTDYLNPKRFEEHRKLVGSGPLAVVETHYLNDRAWFQLNANLSKLKHFGFVKSLLSDLRVAKCLAKVSSLAGPSGSKHLALILQKN